MSNQEQLDKIAAMPDEMLTEQTERAQGHLNRWKTRLDMLRHEAIKRMRANNGFTIPGKGTKQLRASTVRDYDVSRFHELRELMTQTEWDHCWIDGYKKTVEVEGKMDTRKLDTLAKQRGGDLLEAFRATYIVNYRSVKVEVRK